MVIMKKVKTVASEVTKQNEPEYTPFSKLPKTHVLTKEEQDFVSTMDEKHVELHKLAIEKLETSYRPEWSYMYATIREPKR